jgi:hypothetical protein
LGQQDSIRSTDDEHQSGALDRRGETVPDGDHLASRRLRAATAPRILLAKFGPVLAVACVLVGMSGVYYFRWNFDHMVWGDQTRPGAVPIWLAFNDVGRLWSSKIGDQASAVAPQGYDGQFFFYMAQNPGIIAKCSRGWVDCPVDAQPLREERILYPMTARLLALGNSDWLHVMLFLIDFASILVTVFLVGELCVAAGASRWLSVAAGLFCGVLLGLLRDTADPYGVMWAVLAVYLMRKGRPLWSAVAVAAALLTREQLVLVLPLLCLPLLADRRWRTAILFLGIGLTPFFLWQLQLYRLFGRFGLTESSAAVHGVQLPFQGLLQNYGNSTFGTTVVFVAIPLVAAFGIAAYWTVQHGPRALLHDPLPLMTAAYAVLATLTSSAEWIDPFASGRPAAPGVVLAVVVACGVSPRLRNSYVLLLCATVLVFFFTPATLD